MNIRVFIFSAMCVCICVLEYASERVCMDEHRWCLRTILPKEPGFSEHLQYNICMAHFESPLEERLAKILWLATIAISLNTRSSLACVRVCSQRMCVLVPVCANVHNKGLTWTWSEHLNRKTAETRNCGRSDGKRNTSCSNSQSNQASTSTSSSKLSSGRCV